MSCEGSVISKSASLIYSVYRGGCQPRRGVDRRTRLRHHTGERPRHSAPGRPLLPQLHRQPRQKELPRSRRQQPRACVWGTRPRTTAALDVPTAHRAPFSATPGALPAGVLLPAARARTATAVHVPAADRTASRPAAGPSVLRAAART